MRSYYCMPPIVHGRNRILHQMNSPGAATNRSPEPDGANPVPAGREERLGVVGMAHEGVDERRRRSQSSIPAAPHARPARVPPYRHLT